MQGEESEMDKSSSVHRLKKGVWHLTSPSGYLAEPRVGHTATYLEKQRKVVFVGGASPLAVHEDTWSLDLTNLTCGRLMTRGAFEFRYEHCAFIPRRRRGAGDEGGAKVWVFGGADMEGNKNDLWELDVDDLRWNSLTQQGEVPTERTIHTTTSEVADDLLVFGGGAKGSAAEPDTQVYQLNAAERLWTVKATTGRSPAARHGHVLVAVKDKLYVHGGLSGTTFYDDLHVLSSSGAWSQVEVSGSKPIGRASHGAANHGACIYVFGGLSVGGSLNDLWRFDVDRSVWELISVGDAAPSPRLDFAIALVHLPAEFSTGRNQRDADDGVNSIEEYLNQSENRSVTSVVSKGVSPQTKWYPFILIHGGMDDNGQIFDDFHVFGLESNI